VVTPVTDPEKTARENSLSMPAGRSMKYRFQVLETHLDIFGHMNNATYLRLFEEARWDFITQAGYGLPKILHSQLGPVVLEVNVKFKKELRNRDQVTIESICTDYVKKVATLSQIMRNEQGEDCCQADFVFGLFDLKARKLVMPTPEWLEAVGLTASAI
jgi:thioesterase-3